MLSNPFFLPSLHWEAWWPNHLIFLPGNQFYYANTTNTGSFCQFWPLCLFSLCEVTSRKRNRNGELELDTAAAHYRRYIALTQAIKKEWTHGEGMSVTKIWNETKLNKKWILHTHTHSQIYLPREEKELVKRSYTEPIKESRPLDYSAVPASFFFPCHILSSDIYFVCVSVQATDRQTDRQLELEKRKT